MYVPYMRSYDDMSRLDPIRADSTDQTIERELARLVRALEAVRQPPRPDGGPAMDRATYLLLDRLAAQPQSVGGLASGLHLDPSTVTRQVAVLLDGRLARRAQDPEGGRAAVIELTAEGKRRLGAERACKPSG